MQPFIQLDGLVAPMDRANVDTDLMVPKQFLKSIRPFKEIAYKNFERSNLLKPFGANTIIRYTDFVSKYCFISSCFTKSITNKKYLQKAGYSPKIVIGVQKINGKFNSHCWIKLDDLQTESRETIKKFQIIEII